jgi:trimethylamine--corrinoid protein Co-methyltransferase
MKGTSLGIWFGSLLTGSTVAPEQIVLDADLYRAVQSMLQGMRLDDDRLGLEAIQRVGPGGDFIMDEHTLKWLRSNEYYASPVVNNQGERGRSILHRAHERVKRILLDYQPSVSPSVVDDLEKLLSQHK